MSYNKKRVCAIIQARMSSTRLPGKVLYDLSGIPVLQHIIERLNKSKHIDEIIVATTTNSTDDPIIELCDKIECSYFRGSEHDVLNRVISAALHYNADIIVEVTADCPCIDHSVADRCISILESKKFDYVSNVIDRTYPRGLDVQAFTISALQKTSLCVDNDVDRQHVSSWMYKNPKTGSDFKVANVSLGDKTLSSLRLTLDTQDDYKLLKFIFQIFEGKPFGIAEIQALYERYPEMFEFNKHIEQKSYYKELIEWYNQNT